MHIIELEHSGQTYSFAAPSEPAANILAVSLYTTYGKPVTYRIGSESKTYPPKVVRQAHGSESGRGFPTAELIEFDSLPYSIRNAWQERHKGMKSPVTIERGFALTEFLGWEGIIGYDAMLQTLINLPPVLGD